MMDSPLDLLRRAIKDNALLIEQLHQAREAQDFERIRELLGELDSNNADLQVALEELEHPHPPTSPPVDGSARAVGGQTTFVPFRPD